MQLAKSRLGLQAEQSAFHPNAETLPGDRLTLNFSLLLKKR